MENAPTTAELPPSSPTPASGEFLA
ncbi:hypothetical protein TIFTF001_055417, partial [Ficus carica]